MRQIFFPQTATVIRNHCSVYRMYGPVRKTILLFLFILGYLTPVISQNTEEEKIKKAIRAETDAYYKSDADAWQATWLQTPQISRTVISANSYYAVTGWEKYGPDMIKGIKDYGKPIPVNIKNDNYNILIGGNQAWAEYDQHTSTTLQDSVYNRLSRESRLMVKEKGQWKIASATTTEVESFSSKPEAIEGSLNTIGYNLLGAKNVKDAIEVFKLNVQLFPNSWNTYDSLGEAYANAGNKDEAIKNYEKSVSMNPRNEGGKAALKKLNEQ